MPDWGWYVIAAIVVILIIGIAVVLYQIYRPDVQIAQIQASTTTTQAQIAANLAQQQAQQAAALQAYQAMQQADGMATP